MNRRRSCNCVCARTSSTLNTSCETSLIKDNLMPSSRKRVCASSIGKWVRIQRLCYPLAVVIVIRVVGAAYLFHLFSADGRFHTPWMDANPNLIPMDIKSNLIRIPLPSTSTDWLWLFNAFDSIHFQIIATLGYEHPNYAYLPGYPALIRLVGMVIGNYWMSGFLVTQVFALASIVMFQLLAEQYMPAREALYATLVMSTFPYFSVFTTLGYSESVFLFSILSAWYFYKNGRMTTSSLLAGLASVTRIYGFAIVLPMFLDIVKKRRYRKLIYITIPAAVICSWLLYCYLSTGDPFASWADEKYWTHSDLFWFGFVQIIFSQIFRGVGCSNCALDPAILVSVGLFAFLIVKTWQVDRFLWSYAVALFGLLVFTATNHLSLLRYATFIFPIWLILKTRNSVAVGVCIAFFIPMTFLLWLYALTPVLIG